MSTEDHFDHFFIRPTDFERTKRFYQEVLGWTVLSEWGAAATGRGAVLGRGQLQVAIAEKHEDAIADQSDLAVNGQRPTLYVAVSDLRARFDDIADKSVVVITPERTHWGIDWFVVKDPDGNLIAYTQQR
jgi:predicted enzyme related to lactoylglutathione lyase